MQVLEIKLPQNTKTKLKELKYPSVAKDKNNDLWIKIQDFYFNITRSYLISSIDKEYEVEILPKGTKITLEI